MVFVSSLQRRTKPKTVRKAVLSYMAIVHLLCYGAGAQTPLGLPINPQQSNTTTLPSSAQYYLEIDTVNHNVGTLLTTDLEGLVHTESTLSPRHLQTKCQRYTAT